MIRKFASLALVALVLISLSLGAPIRVDQATNQFVDDRGRQRFFRGLNVVVKHEPFLPVYDHFDVSQSFSEEDYKLWKKWGFNIVRLSVEWPGYEPKQGELHEEYLHTLHEIVRKASAYGIYTLLDFHQDDFSPSLCGNGLPNWAVEKRDRFYNRFPLPFSLPYDIDNATGNPSGADCGKVFWALY